MIALRYFQPGEFSEPGAMDEDFLVRLDEARHLAGIPFRLSSTYRAGDPRSHGRGKAVDIAATESRDRFHIVRGALLAGFRRIGVYDRHVHLDADPSLSPDVMWWGTST